MSKRTYFIVIGALALVCAAEFFVHPHHTIYPWHTIPCFEAVFGLIGCVAIILVSRVLGQFILWRTTFSVPLEQRKADTGSSTARVLNWLVESGVRVSENQPIVEIEISGNTEVLLAPARGKVVQLFADPGNELRAGETLYNIEVTHTVAEMLQKRFCGEEDAHA